MIYWGVVREFVGEKVKETRAIVEGLCPPELTHFVFLEDYPPRVMASFGVQKYDGRRREALTSFGPVAAQPADDELQAMVT